MQIVCWDIEVYCVHGVKRTLNKISRKLFIIICKKHNVNVSLLLLFDDWLRVNIYLHFYLMAFIVKIKLLFYIFTFFTIHYKIAFKCTPIVYFNTIRML